MPLFKGSVNPRQKTSLGLLLHAEAICNALVILLESLPDVPDFRRVALRDHIFALIKAYPELQAATQLDVERLFGEEDSDEETTDDP